MMFMKLAAALALVDAAFGAVACTTGHAGCIAGKWSYSTNSRGYCYSCYYGRYNDQCNEQGTSGTTSCKACPKGQTSAYGSSKKSA